MKTHHAPTLFFILFCFLVTACQSPRGTDNQPQDSVTSDTGDPASQQRMYDIITATHETPGAVQDSIIRQLPPHLRALAAFYAAMGGTSCDGEHCLLTTALGLGKQGSSAHKELIQQFFPTDSVAKTVIGQDCYLRPSGASSFSDYVYLSIVDLGDTVKVDYKLLQYQQGKKNWTEGPDKYIFVQGKFTKIQRNLWTFVNE
ncbi:hypothetical protein [Sphingobacterium suaedae]|uniref:Lipoprotein n=1 Tax=Sphingobacterium suaedae TaxID=1686402 RepID=A0ABW5KJ22_9SPHI